MKGLLILRTFKHIKQYIQIQWQSQIPKLLDVKPIKQVLNEVIVLKLFYIY